ncbi:MAG: heavy-metal-associated domain-containing protein [Spirochaetes bacterium]|nr:heavy-metal-associated domain-containing protein [Spirochaetota bacterium]
MKKYTILIDGMSCAHCENHIEKEILRLDSRMKIKASAKNKSAEILSEKDLTENEFKTAVESAGYIFRGMMVR